MKGDQRSAKRRKPQPKVVDLMEALQASLASAKADKAPGGPRRSPAKRRQGTSKAA